GGRQGQRLSDAQVPARTDQGQLLVGAEVHAGQVQAGGAGRQAAVDLAQLHVAAGAALGDGQEAPLQVDVDGAEEVVALADRLELVGLAAAADTPAGEQDDVLGRDGGGIDAVVHQVAARRGGGEPGRGGEGGQREVFRPDQGEVGHRR